MLFSVLLFLHVLLIRENLVCKYEKLLILIDIDGSTLAVLCTFMQHLDRNIHVCPIWIIFSSILDET